MKEFIPLHNKILVLKLEEENKFGIEPDRLSFRAEIQAIGPDVQDVSVGDIVYLGKYTGKPYRDGLIIEEYDIVGRDNGKG